MPWDVQVMLCDMLMWVTIAIMATALLINFGLRLWEMRKAELELKALKRYLNEKFGGEW